MKWSNVIENRVLTVINLLVFAAIVWLLVLPGYNARIDSLERQIIAKDKTIVELAGIARYAITNQYDKIKAKDGTITIDLNNTMNVDDKDATQINSQVDSVKTEVKKGFWGRVFGGNK